jgi:hypothetical protein
MKAGGVPVHISIVASCVENARTIATIFPAGVAGWILGGEGDRIWA